MTEHTMRVWDSLVFDLISTRVPETLQCEHRISTLQIHFSFLILFRMRDINCINT